MLNNLAGEPVLVLGAIDDSKHGPHYDETVRTRLIESGQWSDSCFDCMESGVVDCLCACFCPCYVIYVSLERLGRVVTPIGVLDKCKYIVIYAILLVSNVFVVDMIPGAINPNISCSRQFAYEGTTSHERVHESSSFILPDGGGVVLPPARGSPVESAGQPQSPISSTTREAVGAAKVAAAKDLAAQAPVVVAHAEGVAQAASDALDSQVVKKAASTAIAIERGGGDPQAAAIAAATAWGATHAQISDSVRVVETAEAKVQAAKASNPVAVEKAEGILKAAQTTAVGSAQGTASLLADPSFNQAAKGAFRTAQAKGPSSAAAAALPTLDGKAAAAMIGSLTEEGHEVSSLIPHNGGGLKLPDIWSKPVEVAGQPSSPTSSTSREADIVEAAKVAAAKDLAALAPVVIADAKGAAQAASDALDGQVVKKAASTAIAVERGGGDAQAAAIAAATAWGATPEQISDSVRVVETAEAKVQAAKASNQVAVAKAEGILDSAQTTAVGSAQGMASLLADPSFNQQAKGAFRTAQAKGPSSAAAAALPTLDGKAAAAAALTGAPSTAVGFGQGMASLLADPGFNQAAKGTFRTAEAEGPQPAMVAAAPTLEAEAAAAVKFAQYNGIVSPSAQQVEVVSQDVGAAKNEVADAGQAVIGALAGLHLRRLFATLPRPAQPPALRLLQEDSWEGSSSDNVGTGFELDSDNSKARKRLVRKSQCTTLWGFVGTLAHWALNFVVLRGMRRKLGVKEHDSVTLVKSACLPDCCLCPMPFYVAQVARHIDRVQGFVRSTEEQRPLGEFERRDRNDGI